MGVLWALSVFLRQGAREIMTGFLIFPRLSPVQRGPMTVIGVSTLPHKGGGGLWNKVLSEGVVEE